MRAGGSGLWEISNDLTIVVLTINSEQSIDIILEFYREHGISITLFVDDRSVDRTFVTAKRFPINVVSISNPGTFVAEGLIEEMSRACRTKWMLRIDDDELPTLAMMEFVRETVQSQEVDACGFLRQQCAVSRSGKLLRDPDCSPFDHRQWRLYQPAKVGFVGGVHTPGIAWDKGMTAPAEASLIHLDWALHTYEERRQKVERYDAHTPNAGTKWRSFYLYEEEPSARRRFAELPSPEFDETCRKISKRFEHLCIGV